MLCTAVNMPELTKYIWQSYYFDNKINIIGDGHPVFPKRKINRKICRRLFRFSQVTWFWLNRRTGCPSLNSKIAVCENVFNFTWGCRKSKIFNKYAISNRKSQKNFHLNLSDKILILIATFCDFLSNFRKINTAKNSTKRRNNLKTKRNN